MTPDDAAWLLCGGSLDSAAVHLPPVRRGLAALLAESPGDFYQFDPAASAQWKPPEYVTCTIPAALVEAAKGDGRSFAEVMCDVYGLAP
jgi:hypothetical protein